MLRIELETGHFLVGQIEALNDPIITKVPDLYGTIVRSRCDPFAVRALLDSCDGVSVLAEGGYTLFLTLIPDAHLRICTSREETGVTHRGAKGRARGSMSSERTNFSRVLDIPCCRLSGHKASVQLADSLTKNHRAGRSLPLHLFTRICLGQFPNDDVVLIVACCENIAANRAEFGAGEVCPTAYEIVVLFDQPLFLHFLNLLI